MPHKKKKTNKNAKKKQKIKKTNKNAQKTHNNKTKEKYY